MGIGNFEPLKPYFLEVYTGAMAVVPTLPGTSVVPLSLEHAGSGADERKATNSPALVRPWFWFLMALICYSIMYCMDALDLCQGVLYTSVEMASVSKAM